MTVTRGSIDTRMFNAINEKTKQIWFQTGNDPTDETGIHLAGGTNTIFSTNDPTTWGFNTFITNGGLKLRYNQIDLTTLSTNALIFYQPPTINGSTITQGKKTIELGNSALTFYNPNDGITKKIALNEDGLLIYDSNGQNAIAQYGSSAIIGNKDGNHIEISSEGFGIYRDKNNKVAYINGDQLVIPKTVVLNEMNVGNENDGLGQWSWTVHKVTIGNKQKYNLCLKWLE